MKTLYYKLEDNGDINCIYPSLSEIMEVIGCEMEDIKEGEIVEFIITPIWLTDEEFNNLPEAY
jgi:hypothetical protein